MANIDIEKLNKFNEALSTLKQINHTDRSWSFILKQGTRIQSKSEMSFMELSSAYYIIVIGCKIWTNGPYENSDQFLMGMFDSNLDLVSNIPIAPGCSLLNIEFLENGTYDKY